MYILLPNFISESCAQAMCSAGVPNDQVVQKIIHTIEQMAQYTAKKEKIIRISNNAKGHPWHFDGCHSNTLGKEGTFVRIQEEDALKNFQGELVENHMGWCHFGASLLLTPPSEYEGGEFQYMDKEGTIQTVKDKHYLGLVFHTAHRTNNPELHRVLPHHPSAKRTVLLVFI